MTRKTVRHTLRCFADLLEYPTAVLPERVGECAALLMMIDAGAAHALHEFADYVGRTPLPHLEETYTGMFDLDPKCHLYTGYHLFGDSYKRSAFLLGLKERFHASGFDAGDELPDHLSVMLRFLAATDDEFVARELIEDAILPSLDRMTGRTPPVETSEPPSETPSQEEPRSVSPYAPALEALRLLLRGEVGLVEGETDERPGILATLDGRKGA